MHIGYRRARTRTMVAVTLFALDSLGIASAQSAEATLPGITVKEVP